jgi:hypothetical protein
MKEKLWEAKSAIGLLKRESTRTAKCRLIASVERHQFENKWNDVKRQELEDADSAENFRFFKFVRRKLVLFDGHKKELEKLKTTSFQKKILRKNPSLKNVLIGRSERLNYSCASLLQRKATPA